MGCGAHRHTNFFAHCAMYTWNVSHRVHGDLANQSACVGVIAELVECNIVDVIRRSLGRRHLAHEHACLTHTCSHARTRIHTSRWWHKRVSTGLKGHAGGRRKGSNILCLWKKGTVRGTRITRDRKSRTLG